MESRLGFIDVRGAHTAEPLCRAVCAGLSKTPKSLPPRLFYDHEGSELFEAITDLPEYYVTRTEQSILEAHAADIVRAAGDRITIVEFGSGSSRKTRLLLEAALERQYELHYVPIDISREFLRESSEALLHDYARLRITALASEYFDAVDAMPRANGPRLILFLGSNIGNLTREEATDFLARIRRRMSATDRLLVGADGVKDRAVLEAAYNDGQGITARFNRNLLGRINRELGGHFDLRCFRHSAPYDPVHQRIEMRLVSVGEQNVAIDDLDESYTFADGEWIHTEWSHKYTPESFASLCGPAGLKIDQSWTDPRGWFTEYLLQPV